MKQVFVTTSWDDGHVQDVRLAALLKKYGLKGTFYVSPHDHEIDAAERLPDASVIALSKDFEIGAHTMNHPRLTQISDEAALQELVDSKAYLEKLIKKPVTTFCYPGGNYAKKHLALVKQAGFLYARTTKRMSDGRVGMPFEALTTVNTYNHYQDLWKIAKFARFNPFKIKKYFDWEQLAIAKFDETLQRGGVYHLWGHSWMEINRQKDGWAKLERVCQYIAQHKEVIHVANGDLPKVVPKTLLMVAPYFPPHTGGQEFYSYNIAKNLQKDFNWRVVVATSGKKGWRTKVREQDGLTVYELPVWFKLSNTPVGLLWPFSLRRIMKREHVDAINVHAPVVGMAECAELAAGKIPVVFTYHMLSMKKGEAKFDWIIWLYEKLVLPFSLKKARRLVVSSDAVSQTFLKKFAGKSETISAGVDVNRFTPDLKKRAKVPTILINGTINKTGKHKGLSVLLQAMPAIIKAVPDVQLKVVGAGDGYQDYMDEAKALGVAEHFEILGMRFDDELVRVYQSAHVYTQPSLNDSYPMALVEGLAAGLPCVVTNVGAMPEIVEDGVNGFVVEPGDEVALAKKLIHLLKHPRIAKKMGAAGRLKAEQTMSWDTKVTALHKTLESVLWPAVVQITPFYPPHVGGMENVVRDLSVELARGGLDVSVVTSRLPDQETTNDDIPVDRLPAREIAHTPLLKGLFGRLWKAPQKSVFHIHLAIAGVPEIALLVAKIRRHPTVMHFHLDVDPSGRFGFLLKFYKKTFFKWTIQAGDAVIVFSEEQATYLVRKYGVEREKIHIVPNGVGEAFFKNDRTRRTRQTLELLFVGRLQVQKRVDRLLDALARVDFPYHLTIVGDGEDRADLEAQAQQLGLTNVDFVGMQVPPALHDYYKNADVFVMPSDKEGMSLVMLEALAAGLPVVGSDVQGISEHLQGTGVLVKDPSPKTFAAALTALYKVRAIQLPALAKASRAFAARHSWQNVASRTVAVYDTVSRPPVRDRAGLLQRTKFLALATVWWAAVVALHTAPHVPQVIMNTVGFSFLMFVPGLLTLACLETSKLQATARLILAVALSILEIMVTGLISNTVLQWLGDKHPLSTQAVFYEITTLLAVLSVVYWRYALPMKAPLKASIKQLFATRSDIYFMLTPIVFVALSVLGAISLNNGGSNIFTVIGLMAIALYSALLMVKSRKLNDTTIVAGLFFVSLSLLFMTSLRGWFTTGHDIQREFGIFELAKNNAVWRIQAFRDPYNACLSISILPTMLSRVLNTADPYIYKIFFQLIFALCPPVVYLFTRKWTSKALAYAAMLYFVAFPTFFTDMPMLNRQEIALLFFALMLYVTFQDGISTRLRKYLLLSLSVGLILSHYSTTYSVVVILMMSVCVRPVIHWLASHARQWRLFKQSGLRVLQEGYQDMHRIGVGMIVFIALGSFLWTTVLTNTGNNTGRVVRETLSAALHSFKETAPKADETNYNLLSYQQADPQKELADYVDKFVGKMRQADPNAYLPAATYQKYSFAISQSDNLPATRLGNFVSRHGINVEKFNGFLRQGSAKILQLLILIGLLYVLFKRSILNSLDTEYLTLVAGSIIFVAMQVVLPVISVEYGLLRAFQQSLMLLAIFVVLGSIVISMYVPTKRLKAYLPIVLAIFFFVSSTGLTTQALGNYPAQLNLNNRGSYYDVYYLHKNEALGISWLNSQLKGKQDFEDQQAEVQADRTSYSKQSSLYQISSVNDIYPGLIRQGSYVFLGYSNVTKQQSTITYNGNTITYSYPLQFLDDNKNLLYNNGSSRVYK